MHYPMNVVGLLMQGFALGELVNTFSFLWPAQGELLTSTRDGANFVTKGRCVKHVASFSQGIPCAFDRTYLALY